MSKDIQVIDSILKEMSVDYEPRVTHQLMEFANRYAIQILKEAQILSLHARKDKIDLSDIQLAANLADNGPQPKETFMELAREKNSQPLPTMKPHNGLRLPYDRHTLTATNFRRKS